MKKKVFLAAYEIEKTVREEEYEFGKMTPENESEDGVIEHPKEQELDSRKICQKF
jgi:hypothetical protein